MAKKARRKAKREKVAAESVARSAPPDRAPVSSVEEPPVVAFFFASAALLASVLLPNGPLVFLTPVLSWGLAAVAVGAYWFPLLRGVKLDEGTRLKLGRWLERGAVFLVLSTYLLLKLVGMRDTHTDDNIYFYLAERMAAGAVPYRDFFFAHPPVHLLVPAFFFKVFGFSAALAKCLPVLAQGTASGCLYLALRPASRVLAVLAIGVHLTAYEILMGSTHLNGENIMTMFLMAALLGATRGRFVLSGVFAGLSLGTGLYVLAGILGIAVAALREGRRCIGRFGLGLAASFGGISALFWGIAGHPYIEGVFLYHLRKPLKGDSRLPVFGAGDPFSAAAALVHNTFEFIDGREFTQSLFYHSGLYAAAGIGIFLAVRKAVARLGAGAAPAVRAATFDAEGLALVGGGTVILFVVQFSALREIYSYYLVPMLALLSIPAALGLLRLHEAVSQVGRPGGAWPPVVGIVAFALHAPLRGSLHDSLWPEEGAVTGQSVRYAWRDPLVLPSLAGVSKALFFKDNRVRGQIEPAYRHYVWNKLLTFSTAREIAEHVRAGSAPDETLTGASTYAPLVALYSERRIAADEADTNSKRFTSGETTEEEFFRKICADKVRYILAAPSSWFDERVISERSTIVRYFTREREFLDPEAQHRGEMRLALYRRHDAPGGPELGAGVVCAP